MWTYLQPVLGEIILAITASQFMLLTGISKSEKRPDLIRLFAVIGLLLFAFSGFFTDRNITETFGGAFVNDDFARYVKLIIGLASAAAIVLSRNYLKREKLDQYEFSVLLVYAVLGMGIMVSANDLLTLYIGVEMQALALYVMAAFNRDSLRASEAGLKYFVLGALSSGILLYGASLIYGYAGTLRFDGIALALQGDYGPGLVGGMIFLLCGLAFKISAAPFHMWTPDVYEGAPTPVTGFFAGAPKFAAIALIARVLYEPFGDLAEGWTLALMVFAGLSMLVGALGGLMQTNIKRLMAYSSIANMGYALVPLTAGTLAGLTGMLTFMTIYIVTIIGVFACILQMRLRSGIVEQISDLSGLAETNKGLAVTLTLMMVSLIGIPPMAGFWGKWFAFGPAIGAGHYFIVVLALVSSVVGAFYYLRIIRLMWFAESKEPFIVGAGAERSLSVMSAILLIVLVVVPFITHPSLSLIRNAATSIAG